MKRIVFCKLLLITCLFWCQPSVVESGRGSISMLQYIKDMDEHKMINEMLADRCYILINSLRGCRQKHISLWEWREQYGKKSRNQILVQR